MSALATNLLSRRAPRGSAGRRGSALVAVLVVGIALFGLVFATSMTSALDVKNARTAIDEVRARAAAEAGVERAMAFCDDVMDKNPFAPMQGLVAVFGGNATITPFQAVELEINGNRVASYSVRMTLDASTPDDVQITIESTGYIPDAPGALDPGEELDAWHALSVTVNYNTEPSEVFDFAYFVNNWGWLYGSTIFCNGNAGGNGQFDAGGYKPTVKAQPIYDSVTWDGVTAKLSGYHDDNNDGLADGNDGGIFAGWDIVNVQNVKGNGGKAENQHDFEDPVEMPNLSDLTAYEVKAKDEGSSISIGGTTMIDAVYGDDAAEKENIYLVGTAADPIELDGPVVVKGDVIISGYVTGQGSIYASGNVYVPDSLTYVDPPATALPSDSTQATTEAWLSANWEKDFLGLFSAENVVVGDHTDPTWQTYVSGWMASSLNKSDEDAGEDGIPNTAAGKDGIYGTADDDVLEGDGIFTVETYTALDAAMGLIPAGYAVGDAIPGTGEDIDGDGQYDGTTTMADIAFDHALNTSYWGGNMPAAGIASYDTIATLGADRLDATFYTNHTFAYVVFGGSKAQINGAVICRNEDIVYGTPSIEFNYDNRLLGRNSGLAGDLLPKIAGTPIILSWTSLSDDPNRYGVAP